MKNLTILLFSIIISLSSFSQTPQLFKYQAVVRDSDGETINNQEVRFRIGIRDIIPTGIILYQETHAEFTNDFGVVNLKIGDGTPETGSWSNIDWGTNDKYIELALDPAGGTSFTTLGTTQLLAVPYALYSENTGAAGNTLDQAYDEGGSGAGRTITADAGAIEINGVDGVLFTGTEGSGSIPAEGGGTRMMWYPGKAAFRAGSIYNDYWNDSNIGINSVATGYNTKASGYCATSLGYNTSATGNHSLSAGNGAIASGGASTSIGFGTIASGVASTALGSGTIATGDFSTSIGTGIEAEGYYSIAIGLNEQTGTSVSQESTMAIMGGKVGIGTVSPSATTEVFSSESKALNVNNQNTTANPASAIWGEANGSGGVQHYALVARAGGATSQNVGVHSEVLSNTANVNYGIYTNATSANTNYGIFAGISGSGQAGRFAGNVHITGNLSKGSGTFKIDHPLDPKNKYLNHSFVESPDMMNIYNGNVILDPQGEAIVSLPEWFGSLNKEFRYQLTCIGGFSQVYISEEVSNNQFKIAGGKPGLKISWQVTGVRQDPYANANRVKVEEMKKPEERGKYLYPEVYGLDESLGIDYGIKKSLSIETN